MSHKCNWFRCTVEVRRDELWGCREHFGRLPQHLRRNLDYAASLGDGNVYQQKVMEEALKYSRQCELLKQSNTFHYCSYWGTWSRVLKVYEHSVIELNLTPINGSQREWDEQVKPIEFCAHGTMFDFRSDDIVEELPPQVRERMVEHIGEDLTRRLIETDWLPLLDIKRVSEGRYGGGGLPFAECAKGRAA